MWRFHTHNNTPPLEKVNTYDILFTMTVKKVGRPRRDDLRKAAHTLYKAGNSYSQIAKLLNLNNRQYAYKLVNTKLGT